MGRNCSGRQEKKNEKEEENKIEIEEKYVKSLKYARNTHIIILCRSRSRGSKLQTNQPIE